jgi:hypothetical protein
MWNGIYILVASVLFLQVGCVNMPSESAPAKHINEVLAAHQAELMRIPGVVGVFVGLAEDEKTECIKVMLKAADAAAEGRIPMTLEGYRVIAEVTGEIRPLKR